MRDALVALPWVEADSINANRNTQQVKFVVKDRAQFNIEKVKDVISDAGYSGTKLLTGPTEK